MDTPEDFDEESIWGHCLRHKLAESDPEVQKLIFALSGKTKSQPPPGPTPVNVGVAALNPV